MSLLKELNRRNVFRVAAAYLVIGWLVLQVSNTLVPILELPSSVSKAILLMLFVGFIPAIFFSWAFELTPEGIKKEKDVIRDDSITNITAKKLDYITLAAAIGVLGLFVYQQMNPPIVIQSNPVKPAQESALAADAAAETRNTATDRSIAVLAFADLSPDGDQEYFADGIAEEILNVLVKVDGLQVASRTSAFGYKGQESLGIPEIAKRLNVRHILEGSVRKAGDTIRITAQLIDAKTDVHLWSETFDHTLTVENIFQVQDDIANAIVTELGANLIANKPLKVKASTDSVDAYALFLEARTLFRERTTLPRADALLARAIELDPAYAEAWALRAAIGGVLVAYRANELSPEETTRRTIQFAERALELDPESATAISVLASVEYFNADSLGEYADWSSIIAGLSKALELEPRNGSALIWRGNVQRTVGRLDEALSDYQTCVKYEPYHSSCRTNLVLGLEAQGKLDASFNAFLDMARDGILRTEYAPLYALAQRKQKALFMVSTNSTRYLYGWPRQEELYAAFQNLDQDHTELGNDMVRFYQERGNRDKYAIELSTRPLGVDAGFRIGTFNWQPAFKKYRQSTEFKQYIRQVGIYDFWKKDGFPPQCRAVGEDDFECD
ncbi:MAG: hypothetical protein HKN88_05845 [Gammaproteobacteria bacterium]|nr:hypothetical protein [Gammaproteobacteria bacterium]